MVCLRTEDRINKELNDGDPAGSHSGDIILLTDTRRGSLMVLPGDVYPGWHGGPTRREGEIPFLFAFPGGDLGENPFLENAVDGVLVGGRDPRARDFTPAVLKVFEGRQ